MLACRANRYACVMRTYGTMSSADADKAADLRYPYEPPGLRFAVWSSTMRLGTGRCELLTVSATGCAMRSWLNPQRPTGLSIELA